MTENGNDGNLTVQMSILQEDDAEGTALSEEFVDIDGFSVKEVTLQKEDGIYKGAEIKTSLNNWNGWDGAEETTEYMPVTLLYCDYEEQGDSKYLLKIGSKDSVGYSDVYSGGIYYELVYRIDGKLLDTNGNVCEDGSVSFISTDSNGDGYTGYAYYEVSDRFIANNKEFLDHAKRPADADPDDEDKRYIDNIWLDMFDQYTDLKTAIFTDPIVMLLHAGIMTGVTDTTVEPTKLVTRAEAATMLYRFNTYLHDTLGKGVMYDSNLYSSYNASSPMSDVKSADWYYRAVVFGLESGVLSGTGTDNSGRLIFGAKDGVTREQLVTIFIRYAELVNPGMLDQLGKNAEYHMRDEDDISDWARESYDFLMGSNPNTIWWVFSSRDFGPKKYVTREEYAALLAYVFDDYLGDLEDTIYDWD
jgi:hypothetical protein